jgi:hypothetical protein
MAQEAMHRTLRDDGTGVSAALAVTAPIRDRAPVHDQVLLG